MDAEVYTEPGTRQVCMRFNLQTRGTRFVHTVV